MREFLPIQLTHNIALDLLLRTGVVGFVLFAGALIGSLFSAARVWRRSATDHATFAIAAAAIIAGLVSKGMVESIFEKYRIATALGLAIGIVLALRGASHTPERRQTTLRTSDELPDIRVGEVDEPRVPIGAA